MDFGQNNPKEKYVSKNAHLKIDLINYLISTRRSSNFLTTKKHYSLQPKKKKREVETEERLVFGPLFVHSLPSITTDLRNQGDQ